MTNPIRPGRVINPLFDGPVDLRAEHAATLPQAAPPDGAALPAVSDAEAQFRAERRAKNEAQAQLEAEYGKVGTVARHYGRGLLDALLMPGAMVAAQAETAGELTGWEGLRDFGRDLGRASQGKELMAVFGAVPDALQYAGRRAAGQSAGEALAADSDDARENLSHYEHVQHDIHASHEAWPTLAAASHVAGFVSFDLAMGAKAAPASLGTQIGLNAITGAGFGMQSAYDQNAPLRDVMSSALIGGALGGGLTAGMGYGSKFAHAKLEGGLKAFAERRAFKAAAGNYKQAFKEATRYGADPDRIQRLGRKMLDDGIDINDLDNLIQGVTAKSDEAAGQMSAVASQLDGAGVTIDTKLVLEAVKKQTDALRKIGLGTFDGIADRLDSELTGFRRVAEGPVGVIRGRGGAPVTGRNMSFSEFWQFRRNFDDIVNFEKLAKSPAEKAMRELRTTLDDALTEAVPTNQQAAWNAAKGNYGDYITLKKISTDLAQNRDKNRFFSPSDQGWGGTAMILSMLGGDVTGLTGLAVGAGVSAAHKYLRETGSGYLAQLADRLVKAGHHAPHALATVEQAGGREAQQAINHLSQARAIVNAASEAAGPNPAMRQAARKAAMGEVAEALTKDAGPFNANWITKPPTTLQKILHRGQILDSVANDTAAAVQKVAALRPQLTGPLSQSRLASLLDDADETAAIGSVQMRLAKLLESVPVNAEGAALREGLEGVAGRLQQAGTAETMQAAHDLVLKMRTAAGMAADPSVQAFAARAAKELTGDLSGEAFGTAGRHYAALTKAAPEALQALGDPKLARDVWRSLEQRGQLRGLVGKLGDDIKGAREAFTALTGRDARSNLFGRLDVEELGGGKTMRPADLERLKAEVARDGVESFGSGDYPVTISTDALDDAISLKSITDGRHRLLNAQRAGHKDVPAVHRYLDMDGNETKTAIRLGLGAGDAATVSDDGLAALTDLIAKGEDAVTLDGGPASRVLDWFANRVGDRVVGMAARAGTHQGKIVLEHMKPRLARVVEALEIGEEAARDTTLVASRRLARVVETLEIGEEAARGTTSEVTRTKAVGSNLEGATAKAATLLTFQEQRALLGERLDLLEQVRNDEDGLNEGLAAVEMMVPGASPSAAADMQERLATLAREIPRPPQTFRGKAFDSLSSQDVRKGNAMWEATVDPLSIFDDFAGGALDYDKVRFGWRLYPGLQQAAQMGLMDMLYEQMDEEGRAGIPEAMLSQLDLLFGMKGALQPTLAPSFIQGIDSIAQQIAKQQPPPGRKPLALPTANPTPVQRIAGQRR